MAVVIGTGVIPMAEGLEPTLHEDGLRAVWVCFRDKPAADGTSVEWPAWDELQVDAATDRPLNTAYIQHIQHYGIIVRTQSKWLNAITAEVTERQIRWLEEQPFVTRVQSVRHLVRPPASVTAPEVDDGAKITAQDIDYGASFQQLSSIKVTVLHQLGFRGNGIRIGILDSGFNFQEHPAFAELRVLATRDFINGDDVVSDQTAQPVTGDETGTKQNWHGTRVLSLLAAQANGIMVGAAPEAEYILAKVEDLVDELPVEEDRWIAGLEWADSLGAQVINSSLGYTIWDDGSGYTYSDLDGHTAPASIVAGLAAQRGIVVVNAAGNDGDNSWNYVSVPADAEDVITVGSVNVFDLEIDRSSSRGPTPDGRIKPDVVAPGADVVVAHVGGGYGRGRGTSLATPLVAGTCALLLEVNPGWSPFDVAQALRETAQDLGDAGPDTTYGFGLVNAEVASRLSVNIPEVSAGRTPFPNPLKFSVTGGTLYFPLALSAQDVVAVQIYELSGNKVAELSGRRLEAGYYAGPEGALRWSVPPHLSSGFYIYRISANTFSSTGKFALIRE